MIQPTTTAPIAGVSAMRASSNTGSHPASKLRSGGSGKKDGLYRFSAIRPTPAANIVMAATTKTRCFSIRISIRGSLARRSTITSTTSIAAAPTSSPTLGADSQGKSPPDHWYISSNGAMVPTNARAPATSKRLRIPGRHAGRPIQVARSTRPPTSKLRKSDERASRNWPMPAPGMLTSRIWPNASDSKMGVPINPSHRTATIVPWRLARSAGGYRPPISAGPRAKMAPTPSPCAKREIVS